MKAAYYSLVFAALTATANLRALTEEEALRRVHSHLILQNQRGAKHELDSALCVHPHSKKLRLLAIEIGAKEGHILEALDNFHKLNRTLKLNEETRESLKHLAWSIIRDGEHSSKLSSKTLSLVGAFYAQDIEGALSIERAFESTNRQVRLMAAQMAVKYRDNRLCQMILKRLQTERDAQVLSALIWSVGELELKEGEKLLRSMVLRSDLDEKQRALITEALAKMADDIDPKDLEVYFLSNRMGLRVFAIQMCAYHQLYDQRDLLVALLTDPSYEVRLMSLKALETFPNIELKPVLPQLIAAVDETAKETTLLIAKLALRLNHPAGTEIFDRMLRSNEKRDYRQAAGALSHSGPQAKDLLLKWVRLHPDPYVRVNMALGLIGLREKTDQALGELFTFLNTTEEAIMLESPFFSSGPFITPSTVRHTPQCPRYPELVDHKTRLELTALLASLRYPKAIELARKFLKKGHWSVGATAMLTLLQEGESHSLDIIHEFLSENNPKLRLAAALALAFISKDQRATSVLCDLYHKEGRDTKIVILEALASIGDEQALPILIEALSEPFQTVRVVAAAGLLQSIKR